MRNLCIQSISEVESFLQGNSGVGFTVESSKDKYKFISTALISFNYKQLKKKDKGIILKYLKKVTNYSDIQMKRLVREWKDVGLTWYDRKRTNTSFKRKYEAVDIALLIKTDIAHKTINGKATKEILRRECEVFDKKEYENISNISVSHLYNIRNTSQVYLSAEAIKYSKTNPTSANIGERRKPNPDGKPGFLRVDTVHQGDLNGKKGVYHVNIVDEVTQGEMLGCVEKISEYFLEPLLEKLLEKFPYKIINFHSDNGSEYINRVVAKLLNKLIIKQTKSRSRHCNDNALPEGKNASRVRKHMGRIHIEQKHASKINDFYFNYFNDYLNYHRPCLFATDYVDKRGKVKKKYNVCMTSYEKFKSLPNAKQYLKDGITFEKLDEIAYVESDNECAEKMREAKIKLFKSFKN